MLHRTRPGMQIARQIARERHRRCSVNTRVHKGEVGCLQFGLGFLGGSHTRVDHEGSLVRCRHSLPQHFGMRIRLRVRIGLRVWLRIG